MTVVNSYDNKHIRRDMADTLGETPAPVTQAVTPQNETPPQVEGEEFDKARAMALIEKLRTQVKELTPKAKQAEELAAAQKQKEEAEMTEFQKAQKRMAELEAELAAAKRAALVSTVASQHNLPAALAIRLKGETPEELEADAVELAKLLTPTEKPKPTAPGPVNPGSNGKAGGETDEQRRKRLFG